jgi:4-diphosphocytidyl-2-C-methyl-D-erythritol kinase
MKAAHRWSDDPPATIRFAGEFFVTSKDRLIALENHAMSTGIMADQLVVAAPAKVNLSLSIRGRRADGYHLLETLFHQIDLGDSLHFSTRISGISVQVEGVDLPVDERNLVTRAALVLQDSFQVTRGASVRLIKRIPVAAGLGGGSSDAAATLVGLSRLWRLDAQQDVLHRLAVGLGADVPFFLRGGAAIGRGIGDELEEIEPLPPLPILLLSPNLEVSTAWAYKKHAELLTKNSFTININALIQALRTADPHIPLSSVGNDLEQVVFDSFPVLRQLKSMLVDRGAIFSLMSGSGPTVFGVFTDQTAIDRAYESIPDETRASCRIYKTALSFTAATG